METWIPVAFGSALLTLAITYQLLQNAGKTKGLDLRMRIWWEDFMDWFWKMARGVVIIALVAVAWYFLAQAFSDALSRKKRPEEQARSTVQEAMDALDAGDIQRARELMDSAENDLRKATSGPPERDFY